MLTGRIFSSARDGGGGGPPELTHPFGAFFVGVGNVGVLGGADADPPSGWQSGDSLYCLIPASSLSGWTNVDTGPVGVFNPFLRVADGTSSDSIPASSCTAFGAQMYVVRPNADFNTTGSRNTQYNNQNTSTTWTSPANALLGFEPGTFGRIVFYAAKASGLTTASSVNADGNFQETGTVIGSGFMSIFGFTFSLPSAAVSSFNYIYAVQEDTLKQSTVHANIIRDL